MEVFAGNVYRTDLPGQPCDSSVDYFVSARATDGTGYLAQRTMACRSPRDARFAAS